MWLGVYLELREISWLSVDQAGTNDMFWPELTLYELYSRHAEQPEEKFGFYHFSVTGSLLGAMFYYRGIVLCSKCEKMYSN